MKSRILSLLWASLCLAICLPAMAADAPARKSPPYIILKVDDLNNNGGEVHPRWQKFVDFTAERKIKSSIGIICNSLEKDDPKYFQWIKDQHAKGLIEFWNHGYTHKSWKEGDKTVYEFKDVPYEQQKKNLLRCNELAKQKLGFTLLLSEPGLTPSTKTPPRHSQKTLTPPSGCMAIRRIPQAKS